MKTVTRCRLAVRLGYDASCCVVTVFSLAAQLL